MLETTPTLGSVDCTAYDRRSYARNSLRFNLNNHIFCDLFPDTVHEIQQRIRCERTPTTTATTDGNVATSATAAPLKIGNRRTSKTKLAKVVEPATDGGAAVMAPDAGKHGAAASTADRQAGAAAAAAAGWMAMPDGTAIGINGNRRTSYDTPASTWQTLCSNLIVLTGFAIFAVIVNYVIRSLN